MAERKPSSVASYLRSGKRPGAVAWKGGRGRQGPLGAWLLREKAAIVEGRGTVPALTWREIADLAAADGITRPGGAPYAERDVSKAWSNLVARKLVPRGAADAAARVSGAPVPVQQVQGMVPAPRGQAGTEGASGDQPPAPVPPSTATPPGSVERAGGGAPEKPKLTATSMPLRRRFGDR